MLVTKYSLALALATVVPQVAATCLNDETFTYFDGGKTRTCKNIGFVEEARLRLCTIQEVADACPFSCGSCCEDNPDFKWEKNNPELNAATCKWVAKKQTRIDRYCDKTKTILTDPNPYNSDTITIRYGCPVTCDYCNDAVPIGTTPAPTSAPTKAPTAAPVTPGPTPTQPFPAPSRPPSPMPSPFPTLRPTSSPSDAPSMVPSDVPSDSPSMVPSDEPSMLPSLTPSDSPSMVPSDVPSDSPSMVPSDEPSMVPSMEPSDQPSQLPSKEPSRSPSSVPSDQPSLVPSKEPSRSPSGNPTSSIKPSPTPTARPSGPTTSPTAAPVVTPTAPTTSAPTKAPTPTISTPSCEDFPDKFKFTKNKIIKCEDMTTYRCSKIKGKSLCPISCETTADYCGANLTDGKGRIEYNVNSSGETVYKGCAFVKRKTDKIALRCSKGNVALACRATCEGF